MNIDVYKYVVEILTPTIITSPSGYRGLSYTISLNYIPGSTIRGALFSYLMMEKLIDKQQLDNEALNPSHSTSPALQIPKDKLNQASPYKDVAFAHSLSYTFKDGGGIVYSLGLDKILTLVNKEGMKVEDALYRVMKEFIISLDVKAYSSNIFVSSPETKKMLGEIIFRKDINWVRLDPKISIYVENAVDRARGSAFEGVLYAYEFIEPGSTFTGYISVEAGSQISKVLRSINRSSIIVRIGRGIGRGYGISRLTLTRVETEYTDIDIYPGKRLIMYMASPAVNPIDLPRPISRGDMLELKIWDRYKVAKLRIEGIIGNITCKFYGWSYRTSLPKLPVESLVPGTLAIVLIEEVYNKDLVKLLHLTGFSILSSQGYNFIRFLERDFIPVFPL